jgi:uncharacterized alpha-E superfamily protein
MLSRIAESLYWIGRYIERAEDTARILDVHIHHFLDGPTVDEAAVCRDLLKAMGVAYADSLPLDASVVTELLAFDDTNPSSIVSSLTAARANARGVSEAISSEMWEALNTTYNALPGQVGLGRSVGPYGFFRYVRERAAVVAGLTDSTMSRDDAWRFLVLGRSLERVDMVSRLLGTGLAAPEADSSDWVVLLRSCSAHEAFLRTYRREPEPALASQFLLLDRLFPRSIFSSVSTAEECLASLDPTSQRSGTHDEARRILGLVRTNLEFSRPGDLLARLPDHLYAVQTGCSEANATLAARYFRHTTLVSWRVEGNTGGIEANAPATNGNGGYDGGTRDLAAALGISDEVDEPDTTDAEPDTTETELPDEVSGRSEEGDAEDTAHDTGAGADPRQHDEIEGQEVAP